MVTPHIRRWADSENINRYTCGATRPMGVACEQPASITNVKKWRQTAWMVFYLFNSKGQKNRLEMLPVL